MKSHLCFLAVTLAMAACFSRADFYFGPTLSFPLDSSPWEAKLSYNAGAKFKIGSLSVNLIAGMKSTALGDLSDTPSMKYSALKNIRGGAKYSFNTSWICLEAAAGMLSFGLGAGRLKNPVFSVSSALTGAAAPGPGVSVNLPSWTSSQRPLAAALKVSGGERLSFLPTIQVALTAEGEVYTSVFKRFSSGCLTSGSVSVTGGIFDYGKSIPSTWYFDEPYYTAKKRFSLEAELNLTFPHFRVFAAGGAAENPFGAAPYFWGRAKFCVIFDALSVYAYLFGARPETIYAGGKQSGTALQAGINPQYTLWFGKKSLKTGFLFFASLGRDDGEFYDEFKARSDIVFSAVKYKLSTYVNVTRDTRESFFEGSARIKLTVYLDGVTLNQSFTYKRTTKKRKNTYSLNFSAAPAKSKDISNSLSAALSVTEAGGGLYSMSASLRSSVKWSSDLFSVTGNFALKFSK